ncbi:helix-turn-helix domain-containing protein [Kitasatospora aureofaciens]|uniref:helix-turn-helix domain-containing protein n=1 Tax=Kitasatospora aureofaciens TaxID=1894 RepID=UPI00068AB58C|nr:helix-turn-helix domain-containing protein [Kitasatospora aureofaciens]
MTRHTPPAEPNHETHPDRSSSAERAFLVLQAMVELGSGAHSLADVIGRTGLSRSTVHRILQSGVRAGTFLQPTYGFYSTAQSASAGSVGPDPMTALMCGSPAITEELRHLQMRTNQVVALHGQLMLATPTRLCVGLAHGNRADFASALTQAQAAPALNAAPLHKDAAGLVILANLEEQAPANSILRRIKIFGHARTQSPVPGWEMLSVPLWRGSVLVGSVSLLAPQAYLQRRSQRLVDVTMDAAAAISRRLEHSRVQRQVLPPLAQAS